MGALGGRFANEGLPKAGGGPISGGMPIPVGGGGREAKAVYPFPFRIIASLKEVLILPPPLDILELPYFFISEILSRKTAYSFFGRGRGVGMLRSMGEVMPGGLGRGEGVFRRATYAPNPAVLRL